MSRRPPPTPTPRPADRKPGRNPASYLLLSTGTAAPPWHPACSSTGVRSFHGTALQKVLLGREPGVPRAGGVARRAHGEPVRGGADRARPRGDHAQIVGPRAAGR